MKGAALPNFPNKEIVARLNFEYDKDACTKCALCVKVCSYQARKLDYPDMKLDADLCRYCGLCVSLCPTRALKGRIE